MVVISIISFAESTNKKEAFSYENQGVEHRYDAGPSYEGYSKENMIFGMVFEQIGNDIDPREIKQHCNETDKIADIIIAKLKEKVGDLQKVCSKIEEQESKCENYKNASCSRMGFSCPVNKDAIIEACKKRVSVYMEQRVKNSEQSCKERFDIDGERMLKECERFRQQNVCDKDKFMERCMGGIKRDDFEEKRKTKTESEHYCQQDTDCACGRHIKTGECFSGNKNYVDTRNPCPDFCSGFAGNLVIKCIDNKCKSVDAKNVCANDAQKCPDGTYVGRVPPNCDFEQCPTIKCPEPPQKPSCGEGQIVTAYDEKRCIEGYVCNYIRTTYNLTTNSTVTGNVISITANAVLDNHNDDSVQCENSWMRQQKMCINIPDVCDKDALIEKCSQMGKNSNQDFSSKFEQNCGLQSEAEIKHAEQRCSRIEEERQRCVEQSAKRCTQVKGLFQQCKNLMTEENLRKFIIEEAKKRCKFTGIIEDEEQVKKAEKVEVILAVLNTATKEDMTKLELFAENIHEELKLQDTTVYKGTIEPKRFGDVKLLPFVVNAKIISSASSETSKGVKTKIAAGYKAEEAAGKLVSLRDSDVPSQYLYIIEDKANDVLNVSDKLGEIEKKDEQKGVGYKIKLFLGFAKAAEQEEINQLDESKNKLSASIEVLTKLIDEVPSDVAKAVLKEQVESLKKQMDDIKVLIEAKEKKSKGLLGLFG